MKTVKDTPQVFDPMWPETPEPRHDRRNIEMGDSLPTRFYADQPYFAHTADGGLLCVVTTGLGNEGARGQHVLSMKTFDGGKTWENVQPVESPDGPESSWGIPITGPSGRVFVFYVYNADDLRELPADDPPYPNGVTHRMDSHGYYVFRWSDDHGKTWSKERVTIPVREFEIDRRNPTGGKVRLFWNVGKAFELNGSLFLPFHKVGGLGDGWFVSSEGGLVRSDDLFSLGNPLEASWETLPDGDRGIVAPDGGGPIAEEHSFVPLSDGSIFTVFRTIDGHPACAYSRDQGKTWEPSCYMSFSDGRLMKHPRAANFVWKRKDGGYLYCFHNHGGAYLAQHPKRRTLGYNGRNPMFFCRGWEVDSPCGMELRWSEPEIGLYHDDPMVRISYPDMVELGDQLIVSETQKAVARLHALPDSLADALSASPERRGKRLAKTKPLLHWKRKVEPSTVPLPPLPAFLVRTNQAPYGGMRTREGFSIVLLLEATDSAVPCTLLRNQGKDGSGIELSWTRDRALQASFCDGRSFLVWKSDPVDSAEQVHHFVINVDGASNTLSFFHDGQFCDGGEQRQYGWSRISPDFRNVYAGPDLSFSREGPVLIDSLEIYNRVLTAAEVKILVEQSLVPLRVDSSPR